MPTTRSNLSIPLTHLARIDDDRMETDSEEHKRANTAFRPLCVKCGVFGAQDGSGYAEFGNTRVLAQMCGLFQKKIQANFSKKNAIIKLKKLPEIF